MKVLNIGSAQSNTDSYTNTLRYIYTHPVLIHFVNTLHLQIYRGKKSVNLLIPQRLIFEDFSVPVIGVTDYSWDYSLYQK